MPKAMHNVDEWRIGSINIKLDRFGSVNAGKVIFVIGSNAKDSERKPKEVKSVSLRAHHLSPETIIAIKNDLMRRAPAKP